jgi:hypothetical protein
MVSETIIESVKDAIAVASSIIESAEREIAWLLPAPMLVMGAQYNVRSKGLIQKGGRVRGITTISSPYVKTVSELLDIGVDVRHVENYTGSFMFVADKSQSISSIHLNVQDLSIDDKHSGLMILTTPSTCFQASIRSGQKLLMRKSGYTSFRRKSPQIESVLGASSYTLIELLHVSL